MSVPNKSNRLKRSLVGFIDDLITLFPTNNELVTLRIVVDSQIPAEMIMDTFTQNLEYFKIKSESRDETLFSEKNPIFEQLGQGELFLTVWQEISHDVHNKNMMWSWVDHLVKIASN